MIPRLNLDIFITMNPRPQTDQAPYVSCLLFFVHPFSSQSNDGSGMARAHYKL